MRLRSLAWVIAAGSYLSYLALLQLGLAADAALVGAGVLLTVAGYTRLGAATLVGAALSADAIVLAPYPTATMTALTFTLFCLPALATTTFVRTSAGRAAVLTLATVTWFGIRLAWYAIAWLANKVAPLQAPTTLELTLVISLTMIAWLISEGMAFYHTRKDVSKHALHATST